MDSLPENGTWSVWMCYAERVKKSKLDERQFLKWRHCADTARHHCHSIEKISSDGQKKWKKKKRKRWKPNGKEEKRVEKTK